MYPIKLYKFVNVCVMLLYLTGKPLTMYIPCASTIDTASTGNRKAPTHVNMESELSVTALALAFLAASRSSSAFGSCRPNQISHTGKSTN